MQEKLKKLAGGAAGAGRRWLRRLRSQTQSLTAQEATFEGRGERAQHMVGVGPLTHRISVRHAARTRSVIVCSVSGVSQGLCNLLSRRCLCAASRARALKPGSARWFSALKDRALPVPTDHPQQFLELGAGRSVSFMDAGSGRRGEVLAVHGCPGSVYDFRYLAGELERAGVRVIRVDMPGNARTRLNAVRGDPADPVELAALIREVADSMGLARPLLLAHSVGAQVVQNVVEAAPDDRFLGLALVNPAPLLVTHRMIRPYWLVRSVCLISTLVDSVPPLRGNWRKLLKRLQVTWGFTPKMELEECAYMMRRLLKVDWWRQRERAAGLRKRKIPTLVAYTKDDPMIEKELYHQLSQALPSGPRLVFPDGGHFANKWHSEAIAASLLEFIALTRMKNEAGA